MKILNITGVAGKDIKKGQKIVIKLGKKNFVILPKPKRVKFTNPKEEV